MKKSVVITVVAIFVSLILGAIGTYLYLDYAQKQRTMAAQKQEEIMNKMVRSGQLVSVSPDEIKMKVEFSGDDSLEGQAISVKINDNTTIQKGSEMLNTPGEVFDLTKHIKPGQKIDVLEKDGQALAVYWASQSPPSNSNKS